MDMQSSKTANPVDTTTLQTSSKFPSSEAFNSSSAMFSTISPVPNTSTAATVESTSSASRSVGPTELSASSQDSLARSPLGYKDEKLEEIVLNIYTKDGRPKKIQTISTHLGFTTATTLSLDYIEVSSKKQLNELRMKSLSQTTEIPEDTTVHNRRDPLSSDESNKTTEIKAENPITISSSKTNIVKASSSLEEFIDEPAAAKSTKEMITYDTSNGLSDDEFRSSFSAAAADDGSGEIMSNEIMPKDLKKEDHISTEFVLPNEFDSDITETTMRPVDVEAEIFEKLIVQDDVTALLPEGFIVRPESKFAKFAKSYQNRKAIDKAATDEYSEVDATRPVLVSNIGTSNQEENAKRQEDPGFSVVAPSLGSFGKITTTTVDPIAELLSSVNILEVDKFLPKGYEFKSKTEKQQDLAEEEDKAQNINELLKEDKDSTRFKPGKLNGRNLAIISKELRDKEAQEQEQLLEELYTATFGGQKVADKKEGSSSRKDKFGWKEVKEVKSRKGKELTESKLESSAESLFASILGGDDFSLSGAAVVASEKPRLARPLTSAPRVFTEQTVATSTTPR